MSSSGNAKKGPGTPGLLHVYAQAAYHDEAYLVGDRKGLTAARDAIDRVLGGDGQSSAWVSVSDGEGFDLKVMCVDDPWDIETEYDERGEVKAWYAVAPPGSRWNWLAYPYTDEGWGKESRKVVLWPSGLWKYDYAIPPLTVTFAEHFSGRAEELPLIDEGDEIECPRCGKAHATHAIDGTEGERLLAYRCPETYGDNELIAGYSDGAAYRVVLGLL